MGQPQEVVSKPLTIYVAPFGTSFPAIDAAPSGSWFKLGTAGTKNIDQGGVTVNQSEAVQEWTPAGSSAPRKAFRTDESAKFAFTMVDATPEQLAKLFDDAAVVTVAQSSGIAGNKAYEALRGLDVKVFALLARGMSGVDNTLASQYEVTGCYQSGNPSPVYDKGKPAGWSVEFTALEITAGVFVTHRQQTTIAG